MVCIPIRCNANAGAGGLHLLAHFVQQMVFRLRRMTAKKHVTHVVDGGNRNTGLAQQFVGISPGGAPERVKHNFHT
jgi:hypothetical protein